MSLPSEEMTCAIAPETLRQRNSVSRADRWIFMPVRAIDSMPPMIPARQSRKSYHSLTVGGLTYSARVAIAHGGASPTHRMYTCRACD